MFSDAFFLHQTLRTVLDGTFGHVVSLVQPAHLLLAQIIARGYTPAPKSDAKFAAVAAAAVSGAVPSTPSSAPKTGSTPSSAGRHHSKVRICARIVLFLPLVNTLF